MRMFLPIKGPGGRALTPREKVALLVLGITLVLCVLTLLAGEAAYGDEPARNPVYAVVAALCRTLGGGIVGLYGLILLWSGLVYFKGERIADVKPLPGRLMAALAVTVGISGALQLANLQTAGNLGAMVGAALGSTLGGSLSVAVLFLLMALGLHLAWKGAWAALREPALAGVAGGAGLLSAKVSPAWAPREAPPARMPQEGPYPEDGDPSPDERALAVTQAMEEIERSQGVTIVDVVHDAEERTSIGEEVEEACAAPPDEEETAVRQGLLEVAETLERQEVEPEEPAAQEPAPPGDPYATGGLLRRLQSEQGGGEGSPGDDRPYTSFDWRGRPLD